MGFNDESVQSIKKLAQHNDLMAFHIFDPLEAQLPKSAQYMMSNGHDTLTLDTAKRQTVQRYAEWCEAKDLLLSNTFKSVRGDLRSVSTHDFSTDMLQQTLTDMRQYRY